MSKQTFSIDQSNFDKLRSTMEQFDGVSGDIVNGILHEQGGAIIAADIQTLIHPSGKRWAGKKASATSGKPPFSQENGQLSVTVKSKKNYNYLYFPDDGSNTRRHAGNQQFMLRGAENETETIINLCIDALVEKFGGK